MLTDGFYGGARIVETVLANAGSISAQGTSRSFKFCAAACGGFGNQLLSMRRARPWIPGLVRASPRLKNGQATSRDMTNATKRLRRGTKCRAALCEL
jgi:hypothetical protein